MPAQQCRPQGEAETHRNELDPADLKVPRGWVAGVNRRLPRLPLLSPGTWLPVAGACKPFPRPLPILLQEVPGHHRTQRSPELCPQMNVLARVVTLRVECASPSPPI